MKHLLNLTLLAAAVIAATTALTACHSGRQIRISGNLKGVESEKLIVQSMPVSSAHDQRIDTITMHDGKFAFAINDTAMHYVNLYPKSAAYHHGESGAPLRSAKLLLIPGESMKIVGSPAHYRLTGSKFYKDYGSVVEQCRPYYAIIDSTLAMIEQMQQQGASDEAVRAVYSELGPVNAEIDNIKRTYILNNCKNDVAVFLLTQLQPSDIDTELLDAIAHATRKGRMAPIYNYIRRTHDRMSGIADAKRSVVEGSLAPDFTLRDIDGREFMLSSLRGRYVVLDFWGSWCSWCIKGMPEMLSVYPKVKDKVEFVGIDCNDTDSRWRKTVADYQLPWVNVRNEGSPDVGALYGVNAYPTKVVIDPDGKILKIAIGESPDFYPYLMGVVNGVNGVKK